MDERKIVPIKDLMDKRVSQHLEKVVPPSDLLGHRESLVKLGSLAAVGVVGVVSALAVVGRFGYKKWENHKDQTDRLMSVLIANRMLLTRGGKEGRQGFIENLGEILIGQELDSKRKIGFLKSLLKDEPVDIYFKKGGLAAYKYDKDGAIINCLVQVREEVITEELHEALDETIRGMEFRKSRLVTH